MDRVKEGAFRVALLASEESGGFVRTTLLKIPESLRRLKVAYSRPDLPAEERSRRGYLALCLGALIPFVTVFGLADVAQGRHGEALISFALVTSLTATLALLPRWRAIWRFFRVVTLISLILVLYLTSIGGSDGFAFLWLYVLPLVVFFLFGKQEGVTWVLGSYAVLFALFVGDLGSHSYATDVGGRFLITYAIVSMLAYGLEAHRSRNHEALQTEKAALEDHLAQVNALRGMLPICAACKSVRDDHGYWNQIETYIRRHSYAELSRSLCPDCRGRSTAEPATVTSRGPDAAAGI